MANTFTSLHYHIISSTKHRKPRISRMGTDAEEMWGKCASDLLEFSLHTPVHRVR